MSYFFHRRFRIKDHSRFEKIPQQSTKYSVGYKIYHVSSKRRPRPDYFRVFLAIYHSLLHLIKLVLRAGFINMSYMVHLSFQDSLKSPRFVVLNLNIYATNGTYIAFCLDRYLFCRYIFTTKFKQKIQMQHTVFEQVK